MTIEYAAWLPPRAGRQRSAATPPPTPTPRVGTLDEREERQRLDRLHSEYVRARLDALERKTTPFTRATGLPKLRVHWVTPQIVIQAAFTEWTGGGKLRHPRLLGVRIDKAARDVVRERP